MMTCERSFDVSPPAIAAVMKKRPCFEKGAANSNTNTAVLKRQLEDVNARIIITTIQKLATFIKKNAGHYFSFR